VHGQMRIAEGNETLKACRAVLPQGSAKKEAMHMEVPSLLDLAVLIFRILRTIDRVVNVDGKAFTLFDRDPREFTRVVGTGISWS